MDCLRSSIHATILLPEPKTFGFPEANTNHTGPKPYFLLHEQCAVRNRKYAYRKRRVMYEVISDFL